MYLVKSSVIAANSSGMPRIQRLELFGVVEANLKSDSDLPQAGDA
jgi:hypothetical protein